MTVVHTRYTFTDGQLDGIEIKLRQRPTSTLPLTPPPAPVPSPAEAPVAAPAQTASEPSGRPVEALPEEDATPTPPPLSAAPEPPTAKAPASERAGPGAIRGVKTALYSFAGSSAAALGYVQARFDSITEFDWTLLVPLGIGALISGVMYGLNKFYRPDTKF